MKLAVLIGKTGTGYSAHSPDVPGVVAAGATVEETLSRLRDSVELAFKLIREEGGELPSARTMATTIEIEDVA